MQIIWYGTKETPIDGDEITIKCPRCGVLQCRLFRSDLYLISSPASNYEEIKRKFRFHVYLHKDWPICITNYCNDYQQSFHSSRPRFFWYTPNANKR